MSEQSVIRVDFNSVNGTVKPVHGVGQPPILGWNNYSMFHYLTEAGVPFCRLHDTGGPFGKGVYVDIPNLFRDFDANPFDPASYDFAFTDMLMEAIVAAGIEPYFRLGVTIENQCQVKAYRIFPPKDNLQWARICEGVIRHYTEGWGNGYTMKISHWEIWNEPENMPDPLKNCMWRGSFEQYMDLYDTASKYLKARFPHLKIGGYASCGFYALTKDPASLSPDNKERFDYLLESFLKFVKFVVANKCPLDFFSFHCYDNVEGGVKQMAFVRKTLDEAGLNDTELSLNEWMPGAGTIGSMKRAAYIAAMIIGMQNSGVIDDAELYDGRCGMGEYSPLFNPVTYECRKAYYTIMAFNELYKRGKAVKAPETPEGVWAAAAAGNGDGVLMIANAADKDIPLALDFCGRSVVSCRLIDDGHNLEEVPLPAVLKEDAVLLVTVK